MESKLDPQLSFLTANQTKFTDAEADPRMRSRFSVRVPTLGRARVDVLVELESSEIDLAPAGLRVHARFGKIVSGSIAVDRLSDLDAIAGVVRVEASRVLHAELDLSLPDCGADRVHRPPLGLRGTNVMVGICDDGFDFTHPCFLDAAGRSRVRALWIQALTPTAGEASPAGFGYGVEYDNAAINAALSATNPFAVVRHRSPGNHGTHVAGIAAGNGRATPAGRFVGVAPEVELIVVVTRSNGPEGLATSSRTLEAIDYIYRRAAADGRPCVVNMSLGDNLGPHDGSSVLERGLDFLLGAPGRAFVKSAGNAASTKCHAQCSVTHGTAVTMEFAQPAGDKTMNEIDIWYSGAATLEAELVDPSGVSSGRVVVGSTAKTTMTGGTDVSVDHRDCDRFNGDRRIFVIVTPPPGGAIIDGVWRIVFHGVACPHGCDVHAWIQRGDVRQPTFLPPHESSAATISTPGTAQRVITAGNYATRGAVVGGLAPSSSRGPTRDGRMAPTLSAPGSMIMSADANSSKGGAYRSDGGTSMAAPHVTGVVALMLQSDPTLTQAAIMACLQTTARHDSFTGPVATNDWGQGKLDAVAAVTCARTGAGVATV